MLPVIKQRLFSIGLFEQVATFVRVSDEDGGSGLDRQLREMMVMRVFGRKRHCVGWFSARLPTRGFTDISRTRFPDISALYFQLIHLSVVAWHCGANAETNISSKFVWFGLFITMFLHCFVVCFVGPGAPKCQAMVDSILTSMRSIRNFDNCVVVRCVRFQRPWRSQGCTHLGERCRGELYVVWPKVFLLQSFCVFRRAKLGRSCSGSRSIAITSWHMRPIAISKEETNVLWRIMC